MPHAVHEVILGPPFNGFHCGDEMDGFVVSALKRGHLVLDTLQNSTLIPADPLTFFTLRYTPESMPVYRNVRRSRRLSKQPPRGAGDDDSEWESFDLLCPDTPHTVTPKDLHSSSSNPSLTTFPHPTPSSSPPPESPVTKQSSHPRKGKPAHIPRPPNPFMIFRSHLWEEEKTKTVVERDHRQISRMAGECWNQLSETERAPYKLLAEEEKRRHAQRYPEYRYAPGGRKQPLRRKKPQSTRSKRRLKKSVVSPRVSRRKKSGVVGVFRSSVVGLTDDTPSSSSQSSPPTAPNQEALSSHSTDIPSCVKPDKVLSPAVERHLTPDIAPPRSPDIIFHEEFVPISDIPPLSLYEEHTKDTSNFVPPEYDPHYVDPFFGGFEPESVPVASHLMLTQYSEGCSGDGDDEEPVVFTNPFSAEREVLLPDSTLRGFEIGDSLIYASYYMEQDFNQWVEYDESD